MPTSSIGSSLCHHVKNKVFNVLCPKWRAYWGGLTSSYGVSVRRAVWHLYPYSFFFMIKGMNSNQLRLELHLQLREASHSFRLLMRPSYLKRWPSHSLVCTIIYSLSHWTIRSLITKYLTLHSWWKNKRITIEIVISENDKNDGRPLKLKRYFQVDRGVYVDGKTALAVGGSWLPGCWRNIPDCYQVSHSCSAQGEHQHSLQRPRSCLVTTSISRDSEKTVISETIYSFDMFG